MRKVTSTMKRAKTLYTVHNMTLIAIGRQFHKSHVAIRNWLIAQGVEMRNRGRRPATA
jgi:hypothetical protein